LNYYFVSDFIKGGDLFTALTKRKSRFSEKDAAHVIRQLLNGLSFLHSKGIIHRNIKPDNILVVDDSEKLTIKLVDYDTEDRKPTNVGHKQAFNPSYYVSPEQLSNRDSDSDKIDSWSVGALLYTMISGVPPFFAETEAERVKKVLAGKVEMKGPLWFDVSAEAKDLIKNLMAPEIIDRLHATNALKHAWF
jgi:calcium-dependent protein kinase